MVKEELIYLQELRELHQNCRYDSFSFRLFQGGMRDLDCFYWPPQRSATLYKKKICFCFKIKGLSLTYDKFLQKRISFPGETDTENKSLGPKNPVKLKKN